MRNWLYFILLVLLTGCVANVNTQIYDAQKKALEISPYKSAHITNRFYDEIETQSAFRERSLPDEIYRHFNLTSIDDTIILIEKYSEIMRGSVYRMAFLFRDTIYDVVDDNNGRIETKLARSKFEFDTSDRSSYGMNKAFNVLYNNLKRGYQWDANPLVYGSDNCSDGDHSMVTILLPSGSIQSMYVRCWY